MSERLTLKALIEYAHRLDQELKDKYDRLAHNAVMRNVNSSSVLTEYDKASNEAIQVITDGLRELGLWSHDPQVVYLGLSEKGSIRAWNDLIFYLNTLQWPEKRYNEATEWPEEDHTEATGKNWV